MLIKLGVMVLLLGLRMLLNLLISGFVCLPGHELSLAGKIQITYQNDPKYISSIGPVMWLEEVTHRQVEGEKLRVSGICEERVIARLLGQIWLKDSAFFVSKQTPDRVRGDGLHRPFIFQLSPSVTTSTLPSLSVLLTIDPSISKYLKTSGFGCP